MAAGKASPARPAGGRGWLVDAAIVAGLLGLLVLVTASAPRWSRFLREPLQGGPEEAAGEEPGDPAVPAPPASPVERTINVKLFFGAEDDGGLVLEERTLPFSNDLARQIESLVGELIAGSRQGLAPTLPPDTRVLGAFVTGSGVAYVNLSKEAQAGLPGGSHAELISVYSLVDSITANFPAVSRVQILIDGGTAQTLSGHIDLSRPLRPDMSLLAAALLTPLAPGAPAAPTPTPAPAGTQP
jgi:hypothetical protein